MRTIARYLVNDNRRTIAFVLFQIVLIIAVTSFSTVFSLAWPSYTALQERSMETIPWDIRISNFFSQDQLESLEKIGEEFGASMLTGSGGGAELFLSPELAATSEKTARIDTYLVNRNPQGIGGLGVWTADSAVLKDSNIGQDPVVIDILTARHYGVGEGDWVTLRIGSYDREGSLRKTLLLDLMITTIVMPDDNFKGISFVSDALSQEMIEAVDVYALNAFFYLQDEGRIDELAKRIAEEMPEVSGTTTTRPSLVEQRKDRLRTEMGSGDFTRNTIVVSLIIILAVALLDSHLKRKRRARDFAIYNALGVGHIKIAFAEAIESILLFFCVGIAGYFLGSLLFDVTWGLWVPLEVSLLVGGGVALAFLSAVVIQIMVSMATLDSTAVHTLLTVEQE